MGKGKGTGLRLLRPAERAGPGVLRGAGIAFIVLVPVSVALANNDRLDIRHISGQEWIAALVKIGAARGEQSGKIAVRRPNGDVFSIIPASEELYLRAGGNVQGTKPAADVRVRPHDAQGAAGQDLHHTVRFRRADFAPEFQIALLDHTNDAGLCPVQSKFICLNDAGACHLMRPGKRLIVLQIPFAAPQ